MSNTAKNIYEENKSTYLEGKSNIDELLIQINEDKGRGYGNKNFISAYFTILDLFHPNYDAEYEKMDDWQVHDAAFGQHFSRLDEGKWPSTYRDKDLQWEKSPHTTIIFLTEDLDLSNFNKLMPNSIIDSHKIK
tara:strand:- start:44 stop:445 length:402 start_codon:yes stop_codon:yes gene_type:complete